MSPPPIQWYLARDGKQFGPLSEAELAKFIELGHLLPTDLVWREGFPEWRPAPSVFPPKAAPVPAAPPARQQPVAQPVVATAAAPAQRQPAIAPERREPAPQAMRQQPLRVEQAARQALQAAQPRQQGQQPGLSAQRPMAGPGHKPQQQPKQRQDPDYRQFDDDAEFEPGSTVLRRIVAVLLVVGVLGAAGYFGYPYRGHLIGLFGSGSEQGQKVTIIAETRGLEVAPLKSLEGSPSELDAGFQQAAIWRIIKREFPEWYDARIAQVVDLNAKKTDKAEIAVQIAQAMVLLRRQQLNNALSASVPRLKLIATSFFENLVQLRKTSDVACFEFIARGEASPLVVGLLQGNTAQMPPLHAQMAAVYEAIADGRKTPRAYPSPRREDYEALAADLTKQRGWTQADLQLFTNERALAQATPGKVCQLVHDWFAAQLDVKDPDMQVRLLVDSLKPVVAG